MKPSTFNLQPSTIAKFAAIAVAAVANVANAAQYSKLALITAAKQAGKWDALRSWIDSAGYADEWAACSYLSDTYPAFAAITNSVCATGMATAEELAAILSAARDTAPDALLTAMYERDMKTKAGRTKWHGASTNWTDVAAWETVTLYEDGYVHREPAPPQRTKLTAEQISERRKAALAKNVSARLAAARARRLDEQSQTNTVTVAVEPDSPVEVERWPSNSKRPLRGNLTTPRRAATRTASTAPTPTSFSRSSTASARPPTA